MKKCIIVFAPNSSILTEFMMQIDSNFEVILVGRNLSKLEGIAAESTSHIISSEFSLESVESICVRLTQKIEKIIVSSITVIFAQGTITRRLLLNQNCHEISQQVFLNLMFPMLCTARLLDLNAGLKNANWIFFSSKAIHQQSVGVLPYAVTKVGLEAFARGLLDEIEVSRSQGRVLCIKILFLDGGMSTGVPDLVRQKLLLENKTSFPTKSALAEFLMSWINGNSDRNGEVVWE
jgi:short-subunit dehydrogenase